MTYVIRGSDIGETVFWSNQWGWGALGDATHFTADQKEVLNLPIGDDVEWVTYQDAFNDEVSDADWDDEDRRSVMRLAMENNPDLAFTAADMEDY